MRIGIAGAGLAGLLSAWALRQRGHLVTLFEPDASGTAAAAYTAAAMLAPYSECVHAEPLVFEMGLSAVAHWQRLQGELHDATGREFRVQAEGSLVVAHHQDQGDYLRFSQRLAQQIGPQHMTRVQTLAGAALAEREPGLAARFRQGLWLMDEGCVDNWTFLPLMRDALFAAGVETRAVAVTQLRPGALLADGEWQAFDHVLDCRGFGAREAWADLRGVRGEVLVVRAPEVDLRRPVRLMHPRYQLYIAPRPGDLFVIGATEIESDTMMPVTVRSSLELMSALYSVHSGFAEAEVTHMLANCRPALPDNLPRIRHGEGITRINGLHRHGWLLGPQVVTQAMALVDGASISALDWPQLLAAEPDVLERL